MYNSFSIKNLFNLKKVIHEIMKLFKSFFKEMDRWLCIIIIVYSNNR